MNALVFRGKNWKLASERKWIEDSVGQESLQDRVGSIIINEKEYDVFLITDGFAAVEQVKEEASKGYWVINICGGNINRRIGARDENEAKKRLEQACRDFESFGSLFLCKEDGSSEKIYTFSSKAE